MRTRLVSILAIMVGGICSAPAFGQATANATTGAEDAFGYRNGDESVGIYDELSVRGFNLEIAGNYRVNGTYFVRNSGVSSFFLESTTIRIGYNSRNALLPGPLGVVDYRLRDPSKDEPSLLTIGRDGNGGYQAELHFKHRSVDDRSSYSVGVGLVENFSNEQGGDGGHSLLVGGTLRRDLGLLRARLFGGEYQYTRPSKFRVVPGADLLPPKIERGNYLGQRWSVEEGQRRIGGMLLDLGENAPVGAGATLVFSQEDPSRGYRQFFDDLQADGSAASRIVALPQQRSTSWSGELRFHRQWAVPGLAQRIDVMIRGRRSRAMLGGAKIVNLGRAHFGDAPSAVPGPEFPDSINYNNDSVDQWGVGLSYRALVGSRLSINAGVLRTDYDKRVRSESGSQQSKTRPLLYNVGLFWNAIPNLDLYATVSRGLEEAGVAPANAVNRDSVLDAVKADQREAGVRYRIAGKINFGLGVFETRKPYIGLDSGTGIYGRLGNVEHRGVELSVAGAPVPGLNIVVGGAYIRPKIDGPLVEERIIGDRPVAVPRLRAMASIDYAIRHVPGLNLDAGFNHVSARPARSRINSGGDQLTVPAATTVNAGLRYRFSIAGRPMTVRTQLLNVFNRFNWDVDSSETLAYNAGRQARLALTAEW